MAAGAAAAAAIAQAIKASGVLVSLEPPDFLKLLGHASDPLVVIAKSGLFTTRYQYLFSYKGLAFSTRSREALQLPASAAVVAARRIWIPG
jgi:hypothetical protein